MSKDLDKANNQQQDKPQQKLRFEAYHTSEDDRLWRKAKVRKPQTIRRIKDDKMQINGYSVAEEINLKIRVGILESSYNVKQLQDCHIYYDSVNLKYMFVFSFGVVIFWNFRETEEEQIIRKMEKIMLNKYDQENIEKDFMLFRFQIVENPKIEENTIYLTSDDLDEKYAHSFAFAQSLKLDVFESQLDFTIKDSVEIPKSLAQNGKIALSQQSIYRMIGNIFILRSSINLLSNMLDVPEQFALEGIYDYIYTKARDFYDIDDRKGIINDRLNLIKELYDMLNDDLHTKHTANLEWIVILLIFFEVMVEVVWNIIIKDVFKAV